MIKNQQMKRKGTSIKKKKKRNMMRVMQINQTKTVGKMIKVIVSVIAEILANTRASVIKSSAIQKVSILMEKWMMDKILE